MTTTDKAQEEIEAVLKRHGIETFLLVMKDPDSDFESTAYKGSNAWLAGHASFIQDLMNVRYNSDRYEQKKGPFDRP